MVMCGCLAGFGAILSYYGLEDDGPSVKRSGQNVVNNDQQDSSLSKSASIDYAEKRLISKNGLADPRTTSVEMSHNRS